MNAEGGVRSAEKPVRDLHECARQSAEMHAEFQRFYQEHVMGSQVIHELVGRYAWAAIEKAAWLAWREAKRVTGAQVTGDKCGGSHE